MRHRRFGKTELELSEITFGAMRFVPGLHQKNDLDEGKAALEAALANGVTTIHSSYEYGTRYALGEVLGRHKGSTRLKHLIKATVPDYDDDRFIPARFRDMVETALRELHAERIDIVQHLQRGVDKAIIYDERGDPARIDAMPTVNAALRETFDKLKDEGKVGYLATFPHTPGFAKAAIESGAFDGMVAFFNLAETEMVPFLDAMRERGMGYVTMRPYCQGLLTDKWKNPSTLPEGDPRRGPDLAHVRERFQRLQAELGHEVESWTTLAVKFALADPLFPSVILGMNTVAQVETALTAADGDYPDPSFIRRVHAINTRA
jgi:aryl-alcohol dehydrogenase-like predicted oxidoreductase